MNRAVAVLLALALGATFNLAGEGALAGGGRTTAADCTWQRHSKQVHKRIRRDGRVRRIARVKRWWSCDPPAVPAAPGEAPAPAPGPPPAPAGSEPEPSPRRVSVKAQEFSFILSRAFVVAGEVTVELNNQGEDPHDLKLRRDGDEGMPLEMGEVGPGENRVAHFNLAPGNYRLWCELPQHDEWGMNVNLEVRAG